VAVSTTALSFAWRTRVRLGWSLALGLGVVALFLWGSPIAAAALSGVTTSAVVLAAPATMRMSSE
jgi:hypothetical protein